MKPLRAASNGSTALGALALASCLFARPHAPIDHGSVRIPNPLGGTDPAAAVTIEDHGAESFYQLPAGSLTNQAVLSRATADQICIRVELRRGVNPGVPNDHQLAALNQWQLALRGDGKTTATYQFERTEITSLKLDGQTMSAEHLGTTLECTTFDHRGECTDAAWVRHWQVQRDAATFTITRGVTDVCFTNQGVLTAASRKLELALTVPGAELPSMIFGWQLDPSGSRTTSSASVR